MGLISSLVLLGVSVIALAGLYFSHRASHRFELFLATWLFGLITGEFALHWAVIIAALGAAAVALDGLSSPVGWVAVGAGALALVGLLHHVVLALRAGAAVAQATAGVAAPGRGRRFPLTHLLLPPLFFRRRGVARDRDIVFAEHGGIRLKLDVYRPRKSAPGDRRPAIIQVHGGGWVWGTRKEQGIALLNHLAACGWVGFNIEYRRSPVATYPDHVVDIKAAIAWVRDHADELGVDPGFIAITGGSAGGHLSALTALTCNDTDLQPGFEQSDTSIAAAVPFYGVYDFTDPDRVQWRYLASWVVEPLVFKRPLAENRELYESASPTHCCHADAPPFLIIHGAKDSITSPLDARAFAARLAETCESPVFHAELPGAQHAFDMLPSIRTSGVVRSVERFLAGVHAAYGDDRGRAAALAESEAEVESNVSVGA